MKKGDLLRLRGNVVGSLAYRDLYGDLYVFVEVDPNSAGRRRLLTVKSLMNGETVGLFDFRLEEAEDEEG